MENNEIMEEEVTEVVEDVVTDLQSERNMLILKTSVIIGGIAIAGFFTYRRVIKPFVIDKIREKRADKKIIDIEDYEETEEE